MSDQKTAILNGDVEKVVSLLVQDSRHAVALHPNAKPADTELQCFICGAPVIVDDKWLETSTPLDRYKVACSDEHREKIRELRRERHWG